jgi:DnaJ-class molecular chaperone
MTAFVALDCETPVQVDVERLGAGAGEVVCFKCSGSGVWPLPRELYPVRICVECKGSGFVLVSV